MEYKNESALKKNSIERENDKKEEITQFEIAQLLNQFENDINHPDYIYENMPKLYELIDADLDNTNEIYFLDKLLNSKIYQSLFQYARSDNKYLPPFLEFTLRLSSMEKSIKILNEDLKDLLPFLISLIDMNTPIALISEVAEILANFSQADASTASLISSLGTNKKFYQIIKNTVTQEPNEENEDLIISIISYFEDILNIEKFQPCDDFNQIVDVGFNCFDIEGDIQISALRLLRNASEGFHYSRFEPLIKERLDLIHLIFLQIDSEDEDLSSLAFDVMLNITKDAKYDFRFQIFQQIENDLINHLSNSISINENNREFVLKFINNLIESENKYDNNPIFSFFFDFIKYIILDFNVEMELELKVLICQIFSKITEVATATQKLKLIEDIVEIEQKGDNSFIEHLCSFFGISQQTDYDLVCALYNMIETAMHGEYREFDLFAKSFLQHINIEEIENLFDEPEDPDYVFRRDELLELLLNSNL